MGGRGVGREVGQGVVVVVVWWGLAMCKYNELLVTTCDTVFNVHQLQIVFIFIYFVLFLTCAMPTDVI